MPLINCLKKGDIKLIMLKVISKNDTLKSFIKTIEFSIRENGF